MITGFRYWWNRYIGWFPIQPCRICWRWYWGGFPMWSRAHGLEWKAAYKEYCSKDCYEAADGGLY